MRFWTAGRIEADRIAEKLPHPNPLLPRRGNSNRFRSVFLKFPGKSSARFCQKAGCNSPSPGKERAGVRSFRVFDGRLTSSAIHAAEIGELRLGDDAFAIHQFARFIVGLVKLFEPKTRFEADAFEAESGSL